MAMERDGINHGLDDGSQYDGSEYGGDDSSSAGGGGGGGIAAGIGSGPKVKILGGAGKGGKPGGFKGKGKFAQQQQAELLRAQQEQLARVFDRQPPHAIEAEMALLGSMLVDWRVCGEVLEVIRNGEDFYKPAHGVLYELIVELYDQEQSVDVVQVVSRLESRGVLHEVGSVDYIADLADSVPSAAAAGHYARIVREKATLRRLIDTAGRMLVDAFTSDEKPADLMDRAMRDVFELSQTGRANEASLLNDLLQQAYDDLQARAGEGQGIRGLSTGFTELDEMLSGLGAGDLLIVAARPSMGKTAFALNIAENIAADQGKGIAVFSLEMSKMQLSLRLLCSRSGVDSHRLRKNMLRPEDFQRLAHSVGELADAPLYIDDTPGLTLLQLRAKARRMVSQNDVKCLIVDYLQLMSAPGAESRQQEVSVISRSIKALARELSVPIICLSQLNRAAEQREGHKPRMSDLRESGSIEQDADVIMMLHRESYYNRHDPNWEMENPEKANLAEVIIAKQRNGPAGVVPLVFDGKTTRFRDAARGQYDHLIEE